MRDRSVVSSSLIPSAKYSCSASLDRFAKGRTTNDKRGATTGCAKDVAAATAADGAEAVLVAGQAHQATTARTTPLRRPSQRQQQRPSADAVRLPAQEIPAGWLCLRS